MKRKYSIIKKSAKYAFSIIAGASTLASLCGYTIKDINRELPWWYLFLCIIVCFLILTLLFYWFLRSYTHKDYSTVINGKTVQVKVGDIFDFQGWILIPCNDGFYTLVNDIVINHTSLQGQMLGRLTPTEQFKLYELIMENKNNDSNKLIPTGKIIHFKNYMLLSFAHFNSNNNAYVGSFGEYEKILIDMWVEIRNIYESKPIAIPLIGAGITDIVGTKKNPTDMLKCILCTLRSSNFQPENGISIILRQETMDAINMDVIRDEFS